jgi:hypothetical protein
VSIELRIVETNAVQRDEKPNSLRTLLVPRPLESRLHSNAQVRKRLLSWLAGYSWSGVLDQEEQQEE